MKVSFVETLDQSTKGFFMYDVCSNAFSNHELFDIPQLLYFHEISKHIPHASFLYASSNCTSVRICLHKRDIGIFVMTLCLMKGPICLEISFLIVSLQRNP